MKPISQMTEEERLQEIAELLATAALRYLGRQHTNSPREEEPSPTQPQVWDLVEDSVEKLVLRHLQANVAASPVDIERALSIPHATLARRLARMRAAGFIVATGRTRDTQYSLASSHGNN